eukprot:scaffold660553_cov59-Prasinocladus_malaysianus.AAC.1
MYLARFSTPSSPMLLVSMTSVCSMSLYCRAWTSAAVPWGPMPFLLRSRAMHTELYASVSMTYWHPSSP